MISMQSERTAELEVLRALQTGSAETDDRELVERARGGDQEAFSELVRKHRAQAFGWANHITRDEHMAEDVVQDALIRAFLHLGTLVDTGRFLPWLQRIIRNQAYMKLRRGGPFGKERPFSGFRSASADAEEGSRGDVPAMDWSNIDHILFRLSRSAQAAAENSHDPASSLLRRELMDGLRALLHCLGKRERQIFEAHFFGELSPAEIAAIFETSTANVYNVLSRSRSKVQRERIRVSIRLYVQRRADLGLRRVHILPPPQL
ncbi:RNA polymerase sigma factor [Paenibacillus sp. HJGM_3]|uniref:RNA polymerase sigma factor n=1 Tax=Paenibacillus sp. HJGM_3 TaxID=3379816 RepID=UPI00385E76DE